MKTRGPLQTPDRIPNTIPCQHPAWHRGTGSKLCTKAGELFANTTLRGCGLPHRGHSHGQRPAQHKQVQFGQTVQASRNKCPASAAPGWLWSCCSNNSKQAKSAQILLHLGSCGVGAPVQRWPSGCRPSGGTAGPAHGLSGHHLAVCCPAANTTQTEQAAHQNAPVHGLCKQCPAVC